MATYIFRERSESEKSEIIASAVTLAKLLCANPEGAMEKHRRELLDKLIWKITEAESVKKLRTRYCSLNAYHLPPGEKLQHEHVFEKKKLIKELLSATEHDVEKILSIAVACVVTEKEHRDLDLVSKDFCGWDRYDAAFIPVVDVKQTQECGELVIFRDPRK